MAAARFDHHQHLYNTEFRNMVVMYSSSNKKRNTPIYFNINYHTEMKLVPIIMD